MEIFPFDAKFYLQPFSQMLCWFKWKILQHKTIQELLLTSQNPGKFPEDWSLCNHSQHFRPKFCIPLQISTNFQLHIPPQTHRFISQPKVVSSLTTLGDPLAKSLAIKPKSRIYLHRCCKISHLPSFLSLN